MKKTEQIDFWSGDFGDEYTDRNSGDWDKFYEDQWGVKRSVLNKEFVGDIPRESSILEVGCNRGNQLDMLHEMGFKNLWGIDVNRTALAIAKDKKHLNVFESSALDLPFKDGFFDVVFTSGVLIHISPNDVKDAIKEIVRVSKKYIWCFEYFSENLTEIDYRGHKNRLWKTNFLKLFLDNHPNLEVVKERKIKYVNSDNVDIMFLLKKK